MHGVGSRHKLTPWHARHYEGSSTLDVLARAICQAGCLPRKELHEAWEIATRVREQFAGTKRVVDLCCGFGVLAQVMLLLDDDVATQALAVDVKLPKNHGRVRDAIADAFPQVRGRVQFAQSPLGRVLLGRGDLVVSSHACGPLTDEVLAHAADAGAHVAVLPCCHATRFRPELGAVDERAAAIDAERAAGLAARGYRVVTALIPETVSPKNRLLLGAPPSHASGQAQSW